MDQPNTPEPEPGFPAVLTPYQIGRILRVSPRTAVRWALKGQLVPIRTPSGQYRFLESDIRALFDGRKP